MELALLKFGALGDVLRTTSVLPGLHARHPGLRVTWVTAPGAEDLVRGHPLVAEVLAVDPADEAALAAFVEEHEGRFERIVSLDDERGPCLLASTLAAGREGVLRGAYLAADGSCTYTADCREWFDMGLLSRLGRAEADRLKLANRRTHPRIFADMLGVEPGEPRLVLSAADRRGAEAFFRAHGMDRWSRVLGLNTGAGGRWESKRLPEARTAELALELERRFRARGQEPGFLLLGGPQEAGRNARIAEALEGRVRVVDAGVDHPLLAFAALVDRLDALVASDTLAMHVAIARRVPVVAFFAPTSAAEIELYGRGEKVASTAPDYCSYRSDADTSTLTVERLADAVERVLALEDDGVAARGPRP